MITKKEARYLTLDEACNYAGFKRTKAYELIKDGTLISKKLGPRTLVERRSLDRFLSSLPRTKLAPTKKAS